MNTEDTYEYLLKNYPIDTICRRYKFWYEKMLIFIEAAGLDQKVRIDRRN